MQYTIPSIVSWHHILSALTEQPIWKGINTKQQIDVKENLQESLQGAFLLQPSNPLSQAVHLPPTCQKDKE